VSQSESGSTRVLRRTKDDRVFGGVCGGLGRYLGIDPVLLRIAFVVLALAGGGGIVAYVVAWILIPEEKPGEDLGTSSPGTSDTLPLLAGGALIVIGVVLLLQIAIPDLGRFLWPIAVIGVGAVILLQAVRR
jgi:phage shock protein C